jgi:MFS family permease
MIVILCGSVIVLGGLLLFKLPKGVGASAIKPPRMLIKRRYWLYYVLTFFEGSRKEVLNTFGSLVLVSTFRYDLSQISLLLMISSVVNLVLAPVMGYLVDKLGERATLAGSYTLLVGCCVGFATIPNPAILAAMLIAIRLLVLMNIGLSTYVNRLAPPEELTPTLSAGISINHVTSVGMPLLAAALLPVIGYNGIFLGTAGLIAASVPFTMMLRRPAAAPAGEAVPALAE